MKTKTIKKVIRAKVDDWLSSIQDEEVRKLAASGTVVTGGCIASMLLKEKVNDFDLYFKNRETALAVVGYYIERFKVQKENGIPFDITIDERAQDRVRIVVRSAGIASEEGTDKNYEYFEMRPDDEAAGYVADVMGDPQVLTDVGGIEDAYQETETAALETEDDGKPPYRPVFLSTNAITLSNRVQIITRFYGAPDDIHENYDFVHCTNYWQSWGENGHELVLRPAALEALLTKELRYVGSRYPVCSVIRLRKFLGRGWSINAGQILKMLMQISELDLTNPAVLQDQLTGVDAAYFFQVLQKLREKDPDKVDTAYLIEIIDRLF